MDRAEHLALTMSQVHHKPVYKYVPRLFIEESCVQLQRIARLV